MVNNKTCCVKGCKTISKKNTLFFKVPAVRSLFRRWTDAIKPATTITMDSYICHAHFPTTDYESVRGKTRLKRRVVPSIFDNGESIKPATLKEPPSAELKTNIESSSQTQVPDAVVTDTTKVPDIEGPKTGDKNTKDENTRVSNTEDRNNIGVSKTEVSNTGVSKTEVSNTGVSNSEVSNTSVSNSEVSNTGVSNSEVSNAGVSNAEVSNPEDKAIENGVSNVDNKLKNDNGLGNECLRPKENVSSQCTKVGSEPAVSSAPPEEALVRLDDRTGALTDAAGGLLSPPTAEAAQRTTPDKCITRIPEPMSPSPDLNKEDIEDILTNYHIKQTKPLHETYQEYQEVPVVPEAVFDLAAVPEAQPVFIEIPVDKKGRNTDQGTGEAGDCLMLLESVQVDIDPSSLMLPERVIEEVEGVIGEDDDDDDDDVTETPVTKTTEKKEDPISLLTSSDEDDVIIEEPNIDTVEVSDETDEDDVPLVRLVNVAKGDAKVGKKKSEFSKIFWGVYDFFCVECHFRSLSRAEYDRHMKQHSTVLQVCQLCGYTTASEAQFSRHKKKHKEERKFKCHLCDYKARHNMSLIYHLKTHNHTLTTSKKGVKCVCGFKCSDNSKMVKHLKICVKKYSCDRCSYGTKRRSDLKRHMMRKHKDDDDDDDFNPSWEC